MDGEYWHSKPQQRAIDHWYDEQAEKMGYGIIRIREGILETKGMAAFDEILGPHVR